MWLGYENKLWERHYGGMGLYVVLCAFNLDRERFDGLTQCGLL